MDDLSAWLSESLSSLLIPITSAVCGIPGASYVIKLGILISKFWTLHQECTRGFICILLMIDDVAVLFNLMKSQSIVI